MRFVDFVCHGPLMTIYIYMITLIITALTVTTLVKLTTNTEKQCPRLEK